VRRVPHLLAAVALAASGASALAAPPLTKDHFVRPRALTPAAIPAATAPAAPLLELRATLSAGVESVADVGGHIVRLGETVAGYRLVTVNEDGAVFERDGRTVKVALQRRPADTAEYVAGAGALDDEN